MLRNEEWKSSVHWWYTRTNKLVSEKPFQIYLFIADHLSQSPAPTLRFFTYRREQKLSECSRCEFWCLVSTLVTQLFDVPVVLSVSWSFSCCRLAWDSFRNVRFSVTVGLFLVEKSFKRKASYFFVPSNKNSNNLWWISSTLHHLKNLGHHCYCTHDSHSLHPKKK